MTNWNHYISTTTIYMATKLGRVVTYHWGASIHKVAWTFGNIVLKDHVRKVILISTTKRSTKLGKVINYLEGLLLKSHDPLVTWSCKIRLQVKTIISALTQHNTYGHQTWRVVTYSDGSIAISTPTEHGSVGTNNKRVDSQSCMILQMWSLIRSR